MRIGVLTGGGDCPGLNAVIRAIVRKGVAQYGHEFVGFRDGWRGPLEGDYRPREPIRSTRTAGSRRSSPTSLRSGSRA
jgi:ATP-dependent phosphofructokinase / diphosphate-dependent phosphofructokinase